MRIQNFLNSNLPYLTDAGLETFMIFEKGFELPCFSSHVLIESEKGQAALEDYVGSFLDLAKEAGRGYVLGTETWRMNMGWANELGLSEDDVRKNTKAAVEFANAARGASESDDLPIVLNGIVGPLGDGYVVEEAVSAKQAQALHSVQIEALADAGVDMITGLTITNTPEAIGIVRAAGENGVPAAMSFTVETDGNLPSGQTLGDAIAEVDAATGDYPIYFMINCAHPDHFRDAVNGGEAWTKRIGGIRANASRMSHEELDNAEELDAGDPHELGHLYAELLEMLPNVRVVGGCCGTDHRHVESIAKQGQRPRAA